MGDSINTPEELAKIREAREAMNATYEDYRGSFEGDEVLEPWMAPGIPDTPDVDKTDPKIVFYIAKNTYLKLVRSATDRIRAEFKLAEAASINKYGRICKEDAAYITARSKFLHELQELND